MKKSILILSLFLSSIAVYSQQNNLKLKIRDYRSDKDSISFYLSITNDSIEGLTILKPFDNYICLQLIRIYFTDPESKKEYEVIPCSDAVDLEAFKGDYQNCVYLNPHESFGKYIKFAKDALPSIMKRNKVYHLVMWYLSGNVTVNTNMKNICQDKMISNTLLIRYK